MDSDNYIKLKENLFSLKNEKSDVLETPQISTFLHENENIFSSSFKNENQKSNSIELTRQSLMRSPSPTDFTIIEQCEPQQPNFISSLPLNDSSKSAPKKKFLERTISQTDAEQKHESMHELNHILMRQDSHNNEKILKRITSKNIDIFEDCTPSKHARSVHINSLPIIQPIDISYSNKKPLININNHNKHSDRKPTIETLLKNGDPISNKISSLIIQKETLKSMSNQIEQVIDLEQLDANNNNNSFNNNNNSKSNKQKDDIVTSSVQDSDKKPKSKRSIMMNSDVRKQQIRNSNREAARRCRERRSNYIKQLENKIAVLETKQKTLVTDNGALLKQVHDLKKIILDHGSCNLGYSNNNNNSHNTYNQINNNNFGALFSGNQQLKSLPVVLTLEIPNNSNSNNNNNSNIRQIANVLNGNNSLINNQDLFKHVVDSLHYNRSQSQQQLIDSQSHQQSTKINK